MRMLIFRHRPCELVVLCRPQVRAPGNVLWVGGMDKGTSEPELSRAFAAWGLVAVHLPDGAATATKGFAFLTFTTPEEVCSKV